MPQKPGTYTLPAIELAWFNTVTGREELTSVPAKTITVVADPNQAAITSTPTPTTVDEPAHSPTISTDAVQSTTTSYTPWWAYAGYALWIITLILWLISAKKKQPAPTVNTPVARSTNASLSQIEQAAKAADASALYHAIDSYGQSHFGSLSDWINTWDNQGKQAFTNLSQSLYGKNHSDIDFAQIVKSAKQSTHPQTHVEEPLKPLW